MTPVKEAGFVVRVPLPDERHRCDPPRARRTFHVPCGPGLGHPRDPRCNGVGRDCAVHGSRPHEIDIGPDGDPGTRWRCPVCGTDHVVRLVVRQHGYPGTYTEWATAAEARAAWWRIAAPLIVSALLIVVAVLSL